MSHVLAIARREIEERAFVFVAAIALALVSPLALLMPYGVFRDRLSVVVPLAFLLGVAFTWGLALLLGGTLVGRELSERRLSFYFTRPLTGAAIWFGKLVAAVVLLTSAFVIVHVFPLGFGGREFRTMSTLSRTSVAGTVLGVAVLLMFAAHVLSTWIRSRSPILGLDFVALVVFVALVAVAVLPLALVYAVSPALRILAVLAAALAIAAIGGGGWQLSRGRIDVRRNHRELSLFVWSVIFVAIMGGLAYSRWVLDANPRELKEPRVNQEGSFLQLWGAARGAQPSFVVDPATGAYLRGSSWGTDGRGHAVAEALVSPSLANAFSPFTGKAQPFWTLRVAQCDRDCAVLMNVDVTSLPNAVGVSADATRAALVADDILTVYDVQSRRALASAHLSHARMELRFLSPDVVRILTTGDGELHISDFDVRTRKTSPVIAPVKLTNDYQYEYRIAGPILMTRNESGVEIRDLRSPESVEMIPLDKKGGVWLMRDGREAIFHRGTPAIEIRRNGIRQRLIEFGRDVRSVRVSGEVGQGKLLVSTVGSKKGDVKVYIVDAGTGAMSSPTPNAWPAGPWPSDLGVTDPEVQYRALLHPDTGKVDVIDLRTGAIRPLFH